MNREPRTVLIERLLTAVSRRRRIQSLFDGLCSGLFFGAFIAAICPLPIGFLPVLAVLGTVVGGLFGTLQSHNAKEAARSVDARYQLKDRFLTAWQLLRWPSANPMERLQLEDTARNAAQVDVRKVVPFQCPWWLILATGAVLLAVVVGLQGNREQGTGSREKGAENTSPSVPFSPFPVPSLENLLRRGPDEAGLRTLVDELKHLTEQLEGKSPSPQETLAALSQMEARLAQAINEFNLSTVDAALREVADSLLAAEATRFAALALKAENYGNAADELEKVDFVELTESEHHAVAVALKQNAVSAGHRKLVNLEKILEKMAEQLESADAAPRSDADELAELVRTQELRKGIVQELNDNLGLLGMVKAQFVAARQGQNGGDGTNPSDRPGNNWGTGSDGRPQGDGPTDTAGKFNREQLTGIHGTGPAEIETIRSDEQSDATTTLPYKDVYRDFQKISEAVLKSEPIPLGQRQMIRNYFERIRPKEN